VEKEGKRGKREEKESGKDKRESTIIRQN